MNSLAWGLDEDLHDVVVNVDQTDVLEARAGDEGELVLVKVWQLGEVVLVNIAGRVPLNQPLRHPVVHDQ